MRKQFSQGVLAIAISCLFLSSCFLPTSNTTIKGKVIDDAKRPVADAEVRFGGTGFETVVKTQADGTFTAAARHRPTQMLNLTVSKTGVGTYSDKFPGFAAPEETIQIELMATLGTIPRPR
ncbi:MAG: carboxypeptidase-like regulatory domain-containing protein [Pyrinomonadaceae bacterium]|nr:carboxypeptidase-like regulatory domain-containing protein [Pyrinomonadaceae bacterium]